VTDVGHAGAEEDVVDGRIGHVGEQLHVVGVVGAGQDGLGELRQVDLNHRGVLGVGVGLEEFWRGEPGLDVLDTLLQGLGVLVAIGDHLAHQRDVGAQIGGHGLLGELDAAGRGAALGGGVGEREGLLDREVGSPSRALRGRRPALLMGTVCS